MSKKIFTMIMKLSLSVFIFFCGSYATLAYFIYRSRIQFIPHLQELTDMPDIGMIEVFEWPLDILFPTVPIALLCLAYLLIYTLVQAFRKHRT